MSSKNTSNFSLIGRIALLLLTGAMSVIIAITVVFYINASNTIKNEIIAKQLPAQTQLIENNIKSGIEPYILLSKTMASSEYTRQWMNNNENTDDLKTFKKDHLRLIAEYNLFSTFLASFKSNNYYYMGDNKGQMDMEGKDSWLKYSIESKDDYDVNMDFDRVTGNLALFINYKMYDDNKNLIGITGTASKINVLADMIAKQKLGKQGYLFATNHDGLIQLHSNKDFILSKKVDDIDPNFMKTIKEALSSNEHLSYIKRTSDKKEFVVVAFNEPVLNWYIVGVEPVDELFAPLKDILIKSGIAILIAIFVLLFIIGYMKKTLHKRTDLLSINIDRFTAYLQHKTNDVVMIKPHTSDEIGSAIISLCDTVDFLKEGMKADQTAIHSVNEVLDYANNGNLTYKVTANANNEYLNQLITSLNETLSRMNEIISKTCTVLNSFSHNDFTLRINDHYQGSFESLADGINKLGDDMCHVLQSQKQLSDNLHQKTSQQIEAVSTVSQAIDEQLTYIQNTLGAVEDISSTTKVVENNTRDIANAADKITNIVQTIREVAEQTNLLALNAAIEAARAGDHGKGFAVVADEVRSLAGDTQNNLGSIETIAQELLDNIKELKTSVNSQSDAIDLIKNSSTELKEKSDSNYSLVEDTSQISNELGELANQINSEVSNKKFE